MIDILREVLSTELMAVLWCMALVSVAFTAYKAKLFVIMVLVGGIIPVFVYYVYTSLHIWTSIVHSHVYGRAAHIVLAISIIATVRIMYKRSRRGDEL